MGCSPFGAAFRPAVPQVISQSFRHSGKLRLGRALLVIGVVLFAGTSAVRAGTFTAFGPQNYTRGTGAPVTVTNSFSVLNPNTQYTLKAFNGGLQDATTELVSSGFVTVNGVQVIGPNNFNQNVTEVDVPVTLQGSNTISVQVRGQPGGLLTIEIIGVDNDPPTIQATASPAPNAAGWNNSNVTVTFVCSDATSPVTCPGPTTVSTEGANQVISGTATDAAGNTASTSVTINLDKTPPSINITSPANGATVSSTSVSVTGSVSDNLSGVAAVTCSGVPATVQSGSFSCSVTLVSGPNTISAQATDVAGNTASTSESVTVANAAAPVVTSFSPASGPIGTQVSVTGSNFTANGGGVPQVTLSQQGGGSIAAPVSSFTATSLTFTIPAGGASGLITVTVANQSGASGTSLSVVASSDFTVTAGPASGTAQQGTSTSFSVTLNSTNGFTQLASLSISGVPSGVTTAFTPAQITAAQSSILTVTVPAGQTVGNATLTISASATIDGIPTTQTASVALSVQAASTSLIGRTVESDNNETPIPGITITLLGVDDAGNHTGCSGQTRSDAAGNFAFVNMSTSCLGRQLVGYDGNTATDGEKYAGVNLAYTMIAGQVTGPELVHMPAISDAETIMVQQNASVDQVFSYSTIPGITVTVYAGTTLTLPDGTQPNPFPMAAVLVPVDRLPDAPTPTSGTLRASIVAFQPADTTSNQPVSVTFPNVVNTAPGVNMELDTLDPIVGELVKYGTGTVSSDASEIVPDPDPAHPGHRFGISHFDWHGPMAPAPNQNNPCPDPKNCPKTGDPVDPASGLLVVSKTDVFYSNARGQVALIRTYRTLSGSPGPFGVGTNHNYGYELDVSNLLRGTGTFVTLVMPDGNQFPFVAQGSNTFVNSTIASFVGTVITNPSSGSYNLRWQDGTVYQFQTSSQGALLAFLSSITDPNGNVTTLVRNSSQPSQITQIIDPVGHALNLSYDSFNRILSVTDPIGRAVTYTYNSQGTLATVTDQAQGVTTYAYDSQNRMMSITDPRNITYLQNTYDTNGRVAQQIAADGGKTTFSYTLLNPTVPTSPVLLTTVTDPVGNQTTYHFGPNSLPVDITDSLGRKTIFNRDPGNGQLLSVIDPLNRTTVYSYDTLGNIVNVVRPFGSPDAVSSSSTYDPRFNHRSSMTDPLGHTTNFSFDAAGNLITTIDALKNKSTVQYDNSGEIVTASDPLGNTTQYTYANGNLVKTTDPLGRAVTRVSDAVGRVTSVTNPLGQTTTFVYNALNQVVKTTDARGNKTSFVYDPNGNLLSVTDAAQNTTTITYDVMNRIATRTDPLGNTEKYKYDVAGNLIQYTDRRGSIASFKYDSRNRMVFAGYGMQPGPVFESTVNYTYDAGDRLIQIVDSTSGTIVRTYDDLDRLISESSPQGTVKYTYDAASRRTSLTVEGQSKIDYTFDAGNRITGIQRDTAGVSFTYDAENRRTSAALSNGITMSYAYDAASQLSSISYLQGTAVLGKLTYSYDAAGRRIGVGGSFARTGLPAAISKAVYNVSNELTSINGTSLTYDVNGNLTSDGNHTYAWDARNRLTSVDNGSTASYIYDPFGRRVSRTNLGSNITFLYDGENPVQETFGNGNVVSLLTGGTDEFFEAIDQSGATGFLTDALGSTLALADSNGSIQTQYTFDPFGNNSVSGSPTNNIFTYTGRELDAANLYYYRARYYSPVLQRFISQDPIGFEGGDTNLYAYVHNGPTVTKDPSGKIAPLIVGAVLCATGAAVGAYYYYENQAVSGQKRTIGGWLGSSLAGCGAGILAGFGIGVAVEAAIPGIALAGGEGIFYSGLGAAGGDIASAYAADVGAASISETFAGTVLNTIDAVTDAVGADSITGPAWQYFSSQFAAGAGSATVLIGDAFSAASTYATVELPVLLENGVIPWVVWP